MIYDRKFGGVIALASLGCLSACGSSSPPPTGAQSGTSTGASSGASSAGASAGTSTGTSAGGSSGTSAGTSAGVGSGATSSTDSGPDSTMTEADDSGTAETGPAAPTGEAGEACTPPNMTCGAGLACSNGLCLPSGDAGEPCNSDMSCAVGLVCSPLSITCVPSGDAGEPCNPGNTCGTGLYCAMANGMGTCTVSTCAGKTLQPLPYNISTNFDLVYSLTNGAQDVNFSIVNNLDCNTTTFAPIPNTGTGDAGSDASVDAEAGLPTLNSGGPQFMTYATPPPCYEFLFDPSCSAVATCGFAGAIFTTSAAITGADAATADGAVVIPDGAAPQPNAAGVCIAPGATMVTFQARASLNGALVKFGSTKSAQCIAGGDIPIASDPVAQQTACAGDTEFWLALTSEWATYTVSIPAGEPYNDEPMATQGVWNGFSVVFEPEYAVGGTYVFVRDITWTNVAPSDGGTDAQTDTGTDAPSDAPSDAPAD